MPAQGERPAKGSPGSPGWQSRIQRHRVRRRTSKHGQRLKIVSKPRARCTYCCRRGESCAQDLSVQRRLAARVRFSSPASPLGPDALLGIEWLIDRSRLMG
jgi:hypothetical protein